jgi:hypothetical protein
MWLPVVSFDKKFFGRYQVSNLGAVRLWTAGRWKIVKQKTAPSGTKCVTLNVSKPDPSLPRSEKRQCAFVHRLVYEAFIGPIPDGDRVLHTDRDRANNRPENLRIGSQEPFNYETTFWSINELVEVKTHLSSGWSPQEIQLFYGGCLSSIERIRDGQFTVKV